MNSLVSNLTIADYVAITAMPISISLAISALFFGILHAVYKGRIDRIRRDASAALELRDHISAHIEIVCQISRSLSELQKFQTGLVHRTLQATHEEKNLPDYRRTIKLLQDQCDKSLFDLGLFDSNQETLRSACINASDVYGDHSTLKYLQLSFRHSRSEFVSQAIRRLQQRLTEEQVRQFELRVNAS